MTSSHLTSHSQRDNGASSDASTRTGYTLAADIFITSVAEESSASTLRSFSPCEEVPDVPPAPPKVRSSRDGRHGDRVQGRVQEAGYPGFPRPGAVGHHDLGPRA